MLPGMGKTVMNSDFIVESNGRCFFCLDKIAQHIQDEGSTLKSLQYFSRFLRMDMRQVFTDCKNEDIHPYLLAKVERSRLMAHLCLNCASANEILSKLCRRLEKIEMEVMNSLEDIHRRLLKTEAITSELDEPKDSVVESGHEWIAKLGILNVLRKDAIHKCSTKLKDVKPKINVQNLTERDILKKKRKYKLSSRKSPIHNFKSSPVEITKDDDSNDGNMSNCSPILEGYISDDFDVKHEPEQTQAGIKKEPDESIHDGYSDNCDLDSDTGSPPTPDGRQEPSTVHGKRYPVTQYGRQHQNHNQRPDDPRIYKNMEIIRTLENGPSREKFRCRICAKLFSERCNIIRHIKVIHLKEKRFRCIQCSKTFSRSEHLEKHIQVHSGIKPFKCHLCPRDFSQKTHLQRHLLVHSGKKGHKCKLCDNAFYMAFELSYHERKVHNRNLRRRHKY